MRECVLRRMRGWVSYLVHERVCTKANARVGFLSAVGTATRLSMVVWRRWQISNTDDEFPRPWLIALPCPSTPVARNDGHPTPFFRTRTATSTEISGGPISPVVDPLPHTVIPLPSPHFAAGRSLTPATTRSWLLSSVDGEEDKGGYSLHGFMAEIMAELTGPQLGSPESSAN